MWIRRLILVTILLLIKSDYVEEYYTFEKEYNTPDIKGIVKKYSIIYKLDESLILSIIDLESEFMSDMKNPKSTSSGLMGMLKPTLTFVAKMEGYKLNCLAKDLSVDSQIYFGCRYLHYLKQKYKGNERKMINEYGEGTLIYWKVLNKRRLKYKKS